MTTSPERLTSHRAAFAAALTGTFLGTVNNSAVVAMLADIAQDLDVGLGTAQWIITAYILAFAALMPLAGWLGDRFGVRRLAVGGMVIFAIGSLLSAVAPNAGWLVGARLLQGVGNAPILPTVMVVVTDIVPRSTRGAAMGLWAAINGASLAIGLPIGGAVGSVSWRLLFILDVGVAVVAAVVLARRLPQWLARRRTSTDVVGAALLTAVLTLVMLTLSTWGAIGWKSVLLLPAVASGGALVALRRHSRTVVMPFVDRALTHNVPYRGVTIVAGAQMAVLAAALFATPLLVRYRFDASGTASGVVAAILPASMLALAPVMGRLSDRVRPSVLLRCSCALLLVADGCLAFAAEERSWTLLLVGLVLLGVGVAGVQSPAAVAVAAAMPEPSRGLGMGLFHTNRFVAAVLGTATAAAAFTGWAGSGAASQLAGDDLARGFVAVFTTSALFALVGLLAAQLWCPTLTSAGATHEQSAV